MKKALLAVSTLLATALTLTGCSGQSDPLAAGDASASASASASTSTNTSTIVVGSANFPESQLVASIYSQALGAAGVKVQNKFNIGSREVTVPALKDGSLDLMPEYSGAFLSYLEPKTTAVTQSEVVAELTKQLPSGLSLLKAANAEDKDVLGVTQDTADKYSLSKISDLASVAGQLSLGAAAEFKTRQDGVLGLKSVYGLTFKQFTALDAGGPLTVNGLANGQVQVANVFSTDPAIQTKKFVVLDDDKNLFLAESLVPVINSKKVTPTITKTLDAISDVLTTDDLIALNKKIADGKDITTVAKEWLTSKDLLKK